MANNDTVTPSEHDAHTQHHHLHPGRWLHEFVHPHSGKKIHVVQEPHEVEPKRKQLLNQHTSRDEFDVFLRGTQEHLEAIQDLLSHHSSLKTSIRQRNPDIVAELDNINTMIVRIDQELHRLSNHDADANDDPSSKKFGYSARIRTRSHDDDPNAQQHEASEEPMRFWRTPVLRQYFHRGLLYRSSRSGEVSSFELFIDLLYVGVIDTVGEAAVENASALSFLHFVIVTSIVFKIWLEMTQFMNWFEANDVVTRISVLLILCCLYGVNTSILHAFDGTSISGLAETAAMILMMRAEGSGGSEPAASEGVQVHHAANTYVSLIAFYLTSRFFVAGYYVFVSALVPMLRGTLIIYALVSILGGVLWIASIHIDQPYALIVIFLAIFIDLVGGAAIIVAVRFFRKLMGGLGKYFEYYPAVNIEHRVERTSAFMCLIFGYSVLTSLYQSTVSPGLNSFFGKGILSLISAFTIMWIYFDIDQWQIEVHAIRRHWITFMIWFTAHLPLCGSFILAASTLSELVVAHDVFGTNVEDLTETYAAKSHAEVGQALRWFYCAGVGVSLLSMGIISLCHTHKVSEDRPHRLRKELRLVVRTCVAIVMICLPLAHSLNSLDLIAIVTSLLVFVLIFDLFGNACRTDSFWFGGIDKGTNDGKKYTCPKAAEAKRQRTLKLLQRMKANDDLQNAENGEKGKSADSSDSDETVPGKEWHGGYVVA